MKPKPKTKTKSKVKSKLKVERKNLSHDYINKLATSVSKLLNTTEDVETFSFLLQRLLQNKVYYRTLLVTESDFTNALDCHDLYSSSNKKFNSKLKKKYYIDYTNKMMDALSDTFHESSDSYAFRVYYNTKI